jgi:CubicO group peptidase (beta-lactamase class C family)
MRWPCALVCLGLLTACSSTGGGRRAGSDDGDTGGAAAEGGASQVGSTTTSSSASTGGADGEPETPYPDPDWAEGLPADHGLDADALEQASAIAEANESYCLLVIRHGELVFERYYAGHHAETPQTSWSIAKSHAATVVGIAIERGDLGSLDDPVANYVPEWQGTARETITLRDILAMTSGLQWSAFDDYFVLGMLSQDNSQHAIDLAADAAPGSSWRYHNGAVQILEPVFRNATGMSIEAYAEAHLWSRIGADASWNHDPSGNPTAYASVMTSCRDQARMGYLYLHGGHWAGESVVPSWFVSEATSPSQSFNRAYGYLWWLNGQLPAVTPMGEALDTMLSPATPPDTFSMRGFGNQFVDVIGSLDMIVVRFGADPMAELDLPKLVTDARFEIHESIIASVMDAVND